MVSDEFLTSLSFSAVIRSVGQNSYLDRLLESLKNQSLQPAEIIIVLPYGVPAWDTSYPKIPGSSIALGGWLRSVRWVLKRRSFATCCYLTTTSYLGMSKQLKGCFQRCSDITQS